MSTLRSTVLAGLGLLVAFWARPALADDSRTALLARVAPSIVRLANYVGDEAQGNGTGFFVRADGIVVTNHHVAKMAGRDFFAVLPDGTKRRVLGSLALDEEHDLAIVKVEGDGYPVLPLAEADSFAVGDPVYLLGSSRGLDQSLGVGVISAIRPEFPEEWHARAKRAGRKETRGPIVQHTANAAGGSSGSPVFDARGRVVAVHHSGLISDPIYFGAHVDLLRVLLARTPLDAAPSPLATSVSTNLLISLGLLSLLGLGFALADGWRPRLRRKKRRARRSGAGDVV